MKMNFQTALERTRAWHAIIPFSANVESIPADWLASREPLPP